MTFAVDAKYAYIKSQRGRTEKLDLVKTTKKMSAA